MPAVSCGGGGVACLLSTTSISSSSVLVVARVSGVSTKTKSLYTRSHYKQEVSKTKTLPGCAEAAVGQCQRLRVRTHKRPFVGISKSQLSKM